MTYKAHRGEVRSAGTVQSIMAKCVHSMARFFAVLYVCSSLPSILSGAVPQDSERKIAGAIRVEESPVLDGNLDEAIWQRVPAISEFLQRDPQEGKPATEKTEVKIIYTNTALYFGVVCYDSEPERIIARERARDDTLTTDDTFEIILDTFHNRKDGFLFRTNPLGTKFDSWITEEGRRQNDNWDERWEVASRRTEAGWVLEIEIPFRSIRMPDEEEQTWGIDFKRSITRKNEEVIWSNYRRDFDFAEVSQAGDLVGLRDLSSELRLRIKPYVTGGAKRVFTQGVPETAHLFDAGLEDVKYRLTPGLILDLTVNPDFAQVDVDDQVANLTRFSIFFPERREFFLENANVFEFGPGGGLRPDQRPDLKFFHSRTIGLSEDQEPIDIIAGLKLTGQLTGLDLGFMSVQTDDFKATPGSNYSVLRVRKKLFSRSVVGVIGTNRQSRVENDYNRTWGIDSNFIFFDNLHLESFFVQSKTPGLEEDDWSARPLRVFWQTDFLFAAAEHMIIGRNFNADMGFIPRKDTKQSVLEFKIEPRPATEWIRQLEFGSKLNYITNQENVLETREQQLNAGLDFESGDGVNLNYSHNFEFLESGFLLRGRLPVPPGTYRSDRVSLNFAPYRGRIISGFFSFQREFGFWDGDRTTMSLNPRIKVSSNLSFQIQYRFDDIQLPGGDLTSRVSNIRMNYNFTNNWLTSTTLQYDSVQDLVNFNFRLDWIYRPGDDLFLVYRQTRRSNLTDREIILKLTHSFDF